MSKIEGHSAGATSQTPWNEQVPWDGQAPSEVRELRRAITSQMADEKVGKDLAPMMSELLARLDTFVEGKPRMDLAPPKPPNAAEPPSLHEASAALSRASSKIRQIASGAADPQTRASLANMLEVLDDHLLMRQEVLLRADTP